MTPCIEGRNQGGKKTPELRSFLDLPRELFSYYEAIPLKKGKGTRETKTQM